MPQETTLIGLNDLLAAKSIIAGRVHRTGVMLYLSRPGSGGAARSQVELFQKGLAPSRCAVATSCTRLPPQRRAKASSPFRPGPGARLGGGSSRYPRAVVMPATAVKSKVRATQEYGGEVVQTDGDLLAKCLSLQQERGLTLVHPFDDLHVIAGAGTVGLEILEDVPDVQTVIVSIGGGGLISGVAAAIKGKSPT